MVNEQTSMSPIVNSYTDDGYSRLTVEVALPSGESGGIDVLMLEQSISISAVINDKRHVSTLALCYPIAPGLAKAVCINGLLKIEVPLRHTGRHVRADSIYRPVPIHLEAVPGVKV